MTSWYLQTQTTHPRTCRWSRWQPKAAYQRAAFSRRCTGGICPTCAWARGGARRIACGVRRSLSGWTRKSKGDPMTGRSNSAEDVWAKVDIRGPEECWPWTDSIVNSRRDYGRVGFKGRYWLTHRLIWTLVNGPIPAGACVYHTCDNPPCCNQAHLWLGTNADNVADKMRKERHRVPVGERHPNARIPTRQAALSRMYATRGLAASAMGHALGVSTHLIQRIVRGETWQHVI